MQRFAGELTEEEKDETWEDWKRLVNMTPKELDDWAENPHRLKASINREEAKEEGGIKSGYDSLHRIKRRVRKKRSEWTDDDWSHAKQVIGFNSRMLGNDPGKPVGETGRSKWEISLRNWGHDPAKKGSPGRGKLMTWRKKHKGKKKASLRGSAVRVAQRYLLASRVAQRYIKVQMPAVVKEVIPGGEASGRQPYEFDPLALAKGTQVEMEHTDNPAVAREIAMDHLTEHPAYYEALAEMEADLKKKHPCLSGGECQCGGSCRCNAAKRVASLYLQAGSPLKLREDYGRVAANEPTNPDLWAKVQDLASGRKPSVKIKGETVEGPNGGKGFKKFPSAYANGWAAKVYKEHGGGWGKKA